MRAIRIEPGGADRLVVRLPYSPEDVAKIKTIPGRRWDPLGKYWTVPRRDGVLAHLQTLFAGRPVEVDPALGPVDYRRDQATPADPPTACCIARWAGSKESCGPGVLDGCRSC